MTNKRIKYSLKGIKQGLLHLNSYDKLLNYILLIKKCSNVRMPKKVTCKMITKPFGKAKHPFYSGVIRNRHRVNSLRSSFLSTIQFHKKTNNKNEINYKKHQCVLNGNS